MPNIRFRSLTGLRFLNPLINSSELFPIEEARHDRLVFRVETPIHTPDIDAPTATEYIDSTDGTLVPALRVSPARPGTWRISSLRDMWLFGVTGTLRPLLHGNGLSALITLSANPTTFVGHRGPDGPLDVSNMEFSDALARDQERTWLAYSHALDGNDKVIVEPDVLGGTTFSQRQQLWDQWLTIYLNHLTDALEQLLAPPAYGFSTCEIQLRLMQAEVYWEVSEPHAIVAVGEIANRLAEMDTAAEWHHLVCGNDENANWVKLSLTSDIRLKIYAKTADRIRFEISYDKGIAVEVERYSDQPNDTAFGRLAGLKQAAARRLHSAWDEIRLAMSPSSETAKIYEFMALMNSSVPEHNIGLMLDRLATEGTLSATGDNGFAPRAVCEALVSVGVLRKIRTRARGRTYALTDSYREMFAELNPS